MKRVLAVSDLHCGHRVGLTPPGWQESLKPETHTKHRKLAKLSGKLWKVFIKLLDTTGPYDAVLSLGDLVDGKGTRSGGTELLTSDRDEQADIAASCFAEIRRRCNPDAPIVGVYGTPYHTSADGEDWEGVAAERAGFASLGSHEWVDVDGLVFDIKHKVGGSTIPHGRHTATARERLWNVLWADAQMQPKAQVFLRGHVHYHQFCGGPGWLGMTLPALQGMGSKYGARQCSGMVHFGLTTFDVEGGALLGWAAHTLRVKEQEATAYKVGT